MESKESETKHFVLAYSSGPTHAHNMDLTISTKVLFLPFATPFCFGVPSAVNWDMISFSTK